ncbi:MAG: transposase [Pseudomonadota bacterium]|nr:transposase [Pseudomonadota bacterium]MDP1572943.1 transposase [Pseudomonadota bacterium]MDP1906179.1 transposase [Pseudomonadota bacterium]
MLTYKEDGGTYFITLECFQRQPLLARPRLKQMLIDAMLKTKTQFGLHLAAYVILDDHVHLLFVAPAEGECLAPMNYLRALMTRTWREHDQVLDETPFWSHGVKQRTLADADALRAHLDYIHYDAVSHGQCQHAFDYVWSSLPARVEQGHYPEDWAILGPPASLRRVEACR